MTNPTTNTRVATWHVFGTDVQGCTTPADVLKEARLDYTVDLQPIHSINPATGAYEPVANRYATMRMTDGHVYEVVSDRYQIVQNEQAFDFINYFDEPVRGMYGTSLKWVSAGETPSGIVYMIAALPSQKVLDDEFTPFMIFQNTFNKKGGVKTTICPLRMICQNQFNYAFKNSKGTHMIKHIGYMEGKLLEARETFHYAIEHMATLNDAAERMAATRLTYTQMSTLIDSLFPLREDSKSGFARDAAEKKRDAFVKCLNVDDNANYAGTAYGFMNAYSDYMTHTITSNRKSDDASALFTKTCLKEGSMNDALKAIEMVTGVAA